MVNKHLNKALFLGGTLGGWLTSHYCNWNNWNLVMLFLAEKWGLVGCFNTPLEHTPKPVPTGYNGIPFMRGCVVIFLDMNILILSRSGFKICPSGKSWRMPRHDVERRPPPWTSVQKPFPPTSSMDLLTCRHVSGRMESSQRHGEVLREG